MAKAAPKVAGKWKGDGVIVWREVNGEPYAIAGRTRVDGYFRIGSAPMQDVQATALDLIQAACDAELIRQGSPNASLSKDQVRSIRSLYAAGGRSHQSLGLEFGVSKRAIGRIINRESYADV
jgi:hypothetical protein